MLWMHRLFACLPPHLFYRLLLSVIPGKGTRPHTQNTASINSHWQQFCLLYCIPHHQEPHLECAHCKSKLTCHSRVLVFLQLQHGWWPAGLHHQQTHTRVPHLHLHFWYTFETVTDRTYKISMVGGQQGYIISKLTLVYHIFTCISGIPLKQLLIALIK